MKRREVLKRGVQGSLSLGIAKALHNTTIGYGHFGLGDNLHDQDLHALLEQGIRLPYTSERSIDGYRVKRQRNDLTYNNDGDWHEISPSSPQSLQDMATAVSHIDAGSFSASFSDPNTFFETCTHHTPNPHVVESIRANRLPPADPSRVETVTGVSPSDSKRTVSGLIEGFREHGAYDIPRYLAGSIEDNVIVGAADLREPFLPEESFEELLSQDEAVGLFCGELTRLSIRAMHAMPATEQSPPLFGFYVLNRRHKHAYTGFGTAIVDDDNLHLPITFVDYTHTTLYHDLHIDRFFDDPENAYTEWQRADQFIF